jgi:membrane-anchored glycerophosphoryl diester phosphodiesterase (GDPDase)
MPAKHPKKSHYENNPFFIASSGITLLFNLAQGVAVMLIIFAVVSFLGNAVVPDNSSDSSSAGLSDTIQSLQSWTPSEWLVLIFTVSIVGLAVIMIASLFAGVNAYTAARLARGEEVQIREAFREAFEKLWGFIWLQIIIFVKTVLWSLLFIIPGIIMAVRYSLAEVAFFDDTKNLRGNAAVKESLRLTKGAWITTYASYALFNILTFGIIGNLVNTGVSAVLYRQYQEAGGKKPAAHILSWLTLVLPLVFAIMIFFGLIFIAIIVGLLGQRTI